MKLSAARYAATTSSPALLEYSEKPANIGIRASLPGWIQRIEVTIRARNKYDAYRRYSDHLDQRLAIVDTLLDRPIASGWIKEIQLDGRDVIYIAAGPWKEHERELDVTNYTATDTITAVLQALLTAHVDRVSSDQSQIGTNTTQIGADWDPNANGGQYPADLIKELLEMSDSAGATWDYWTQEAPLSHGQLNLARPYYKARSATATAGYTLRRSDFVTMGLTLARHIWDYVSEVEVYYGGTPTGTGGTTSTSAAYGTREKILERAKHTATLAGQLEQERINVYEDPAQQQAFTISSPRIRAASGAMVPLWDMIKNGPAYIRAPLSPELSLYAAGQDGLQAFFISALDYDHRTNTMRIVPELPDLRLDAILKRASGIEEATGEGISRRSTVKNR